MKVQPPPLSGHTPRVFARRLAHHPQCAYFAYVPLGDVDPHRIFVSVHGITRNALEHVLLFQPWAERLGVAMIAPLFTRAAFSGYQTLNANGDIPADEAFDLICDDARALLGLPNAKLHLFGYSGGGQFAHRYLLKHPRRVARAVIGAAGWYTFPDAAVPYPMGLATPDGTFCDPAAIAELPPTRVIVGDADKSRDASLNRNPRIDAQQGRNRHSRGRRWVRAMNAAMKAQGLRRRCSFRSLPGATHSFAAAMQAYGLDRAVVDFLFHPTDPSIDENSNEQEIDA